MRKVNMVSLFQKFPKRVTTWGNASFPRNMFQYELGGKGEIIDMESGIKRIWDRTPLTLPQKFAHSKMILPQNPENSILFY